MNAVVFYFMLQLKHGRIGATIEQEIAQLEKQLQEKKANLEQQPEQKELPPDKEMLREVIGEKIQQHAPAYVPKPIQQAQTDDTDSIPTELKIKSRNSLTMFFKIAWTGE